MSLREEVRKIIQERIGAPKDFDDNSLFADIGSDSLAMMDLIMEVEDNFGLEISDEDVEKMQTPNDLINYIEGQVNE